MRQERCKSGIKFEKATCKQMNWANIESKPKLFYNGIVDDNAICPCGNTDDKNVRKIFKQCCGRNNILKMGSVNLDLSKFKINYDKSSFEKYDSIDSNGKKWEIKDYALSKCNTYHLFSEPLPCIKNYREITYLLKSFGGSKCTIEKSILLLKLRKEYKKSKNIKEKNLVDKQLKELVTPDITKRWNDFTLKLYKKSKPNLINKLTKSLAGIKLQDTLVAINNIEFKWDKGDCNFCGCDRYVIKFKVND